MIPDPGAPQHLNCILWSGLPRADFLVTTKAYKIRSIQHEGVLLLLSSTRDKVDLAAFLEWPLYHALEVLMRSLASTLTSAKYNRH